MHWIFFDKYLEYTVGGAQHSSRMLLHYLKAPFELVSCSTGKHFSTALNAVSGLKTTKIRTHELSYLPYLEYSLNRGIISKFFKKYTKNDVLFTQELYAPPAINAFPGRSIYFIRSEYNCNLVANYFSGIKRGLKEAYNMLQIPFIRQFTADNMNAASSATLVIANSHYTAQLVREHLKCEAEIIYPFIDCLSLIENSKKPGPRSLITSIGTEVIKGAHITGMIAMRSPRQFQIVGRSFNNIRQERNVNFRPWDADPVNVYNETRILLVPSLVNEGFGRVVIEAMAFGIPVIASARGGLKEAALPELLISDPYDIDQWLEKIDYVESNFELLQDSGIEKAKSFDARIQLQKCKDLISKRLDISLD